VSLPPVAFALPEGMFSLRLCVEIPRGPEYPTPPTLLARKPARSSRMIAPFVPRGVRMSVWARASDVVDATAPAAAAARSVRERWEQRDRGAAGMTRTLAPSPLLPRAHVIVRRRAAGVS
jgi:hypothetical protein